MKKLALLGGAAGIGLFALFSAPITHAADHLDAPTIKMTANAMADINDVYAWMTSDGTKVNLAMTISPFDDGTRSFGTGVTYAFHLTQHVSLPLTAAAHAAGKESKIICTFTSNTAGQCWVVDPAGAVVDYVSGDLSGSAGRVSASGKFRVFAGRRSDPFFFNLAGFLTAQKIATDLCATGVFEPDCPGALAISPGVDDAGCPLISAAAAGLLRDELSEEQNGTDANSTLGGCTASQRDCFLNANVMAIVVQVDKAEVATDVNKVLGVWASTHAGS